MSNSDLKNKGFCSCDYLTQRSSLREKVKKLSKITFPSASYQGWHVFGGGLGVGSHSDADFYFCFFEKIFSIFIIIENIFCDDGRRVLSGGVLAGSESDALLDFF